MGKYTLHYFDIEGRAESIRLTFALAGVEFEDHRFGSRDEFKAMKESGKLQFGQVPAVDVEIDGTVTTLTQTASIMRYIAKQKGDLYPSDDLVAAKVDALMDQRSDAYTGLSVAKYKDRFGFAILNDHSDIADAAKDAWNKDVIPKHLGLLVKALEVGKTGWLAGTDGPSLADVLWAPDLKALNDGKSNGDDTVLNAFPAIREYLKKFYSLPTIVAYYGNSNQCQIA